MCDLNLNATDGEIQTKVENIIHGYLRNQNQERANFFQEVLRRILSPPVVIDSEPVIDIVAPTQRNRQRQLVSVHSQFRTGYYNAPSTDFRFDLSEPQRNVVAISIAAVEIPRTYDTISSTIGNTTMVVLGASDDVAWRVTLASGNYDVGITTNDDDFTANVTAVNDAILSATPGTVDDAGTFTENSDGDALTSDNLTYSLNERTHKSTFTTDGGVVAIRFNVDETGSVDTDQPLIFRLGWVLGFRYAEYTFQDSISSAGVAFLSGPRYWFISLEDQQHQHTAPFVVVYNDWGISRQIVSRVDVAHKTDKRIVRTHLSLARRYTGPVDISQLHIRLLDEFGRVVDLNEMDWSCVLEFTKVEMGWDEPSNNMNGV
jgi:hypothetical protein